MSHAGEANGLITGYRLVGAFVCQKTSDQPVELLLGARGFSFASEASTIDSVIDEHIERGDSSGRAGQVSGFDLHVVREAPSTVTVIGVPQDTRRDQLLDALPVAIFQIDLNDQLLYVNQEVKLLTDYQPSELAGSNWTKALSKETFLRIRQSLTKAADPNATIHTNYRMTTPMNERKSLAVSARLLFDGSNNPKAFLVVVTDVSDRAELDDRVKWLAEHDSLTEVLNREAITRHIKTIIDSGEQDDCALLFIDLDGFKQINDTYGHDHGDEILKVAARRMTRAVRPRDVVGRMGGDEFAILGHGLSTDESAMSVAHKLSSLLSAPIAVGGRVHAVRGSVGVALGKSLPEAGDDLTADDRCAQWIRRADTAMYLVKRSDDPTQTVCLHQKNMEEDQRRLSRQRDELERFIDSGVVSTVFQPLVYGDGTLHGYEVLARPRGLVEHGDINELIKTALREGDFPEFFDKLSATCLNDINTVIESSPQGLLNAFKKPVVFNINANMQQLLSASAVENLLERLRKLRLEGHRVRLEVTESTFDRQAKVIHAQASLLRAAGVGLSIDDFGSGYSPLRRIVDYGFAQVKIHSSFVREAPTDAAAEGLIRALIAMTKAVDLELVGEGVETQEQFDCLRSLGVRIFQGHFFCKPMSWEHLNARYG